MSHQSDMNMEDPDMVVINTMDLDMDDPDVVVINGNAINSGSPENVSPIVSTSEHIYINVNTDSLSIEQARSEANVYGPELKVVSTLSKKLPNLGATLGSAADTVKPKVNVVLHKDAPLSTDEVLQKIRDLLGLDLLSPVTSAGGIELAVRPDQILQIATIDSVNCIEPHRELSGHNEHARGILGLNSDYSSVGISQEAYRWRGRGEVVCVADSGVDVSHRAFKDRVHDQINMWDPFKGMELSEDYNGHDTHVAGSVIEGVAQECKIIVQGMCQDKTGTGYFYSRSSMFKDAFDAGAAIHTNSWGPSWDEEQAEYNSIAYDLDDSIWNKNYQDWVICISAGNDGPANNWQNEIGAINAAKNAICVCNGISTRPDDMCLNAGWPYPDPRSIASSSSCGPTKAEGNELGRIKPDVIAPGTAILSCKSPTITEQRFKGFGCSSRPGYMFASGTSMATPHVAGCCAVIHEALTSPLGGGLKFTNTFPGGYLVKALLINGTIDLKNHLSGSGEPIPRAPNNWQGHGRVDLMNSLLHIERMRRGDPGTGYFDAGLTQEDSRKDEDNYPRPLKSGGEWVSDVITCDSKVFSVTLAYYDPPDKVSQNQLNLIVYNGEGRKYWMCGNTHSKNRNWRDDVYDRVNNVEKVVWERSRYDSNQFKIFVWAQRISQPLDDDAGQQSFAVAYMSHE